MSRLVSVCALALALALGCNAPQQKARITQLEGDLQSFSYAVGVDMARNLKTLPGELDFQAVLQGIEEGYSGEGLLLSEEECSTLMRAGIQERQQSAADQAREEGVKFLEENAKRDGVKVTDSGLQYEVLTAAEGPKPSASSMVTVHYTGTLIDGTKFDSSRDRGEPATFPLNGVIRGWTEGLQLMSPGASYRFTIPSDLAYGERGAGGVIPPGATLIFDVELLSFE